MGKFIVLLLVVLSGCAMSDENLAAYYDMQKQHDIKQAEQADKTIESIKMLSSTTSFQTQNEQTMFVVIQALLIDRVRYQPLEVRPPMTVNEFWNNNLIGLLNILNPWALAIVYDRNNKDTYRITATDKATLNFDSNNSGNDNLSYGDFAQTLSITKSDSVSDESRPTWTTNANRNQTSEGWAGGVPW